VSIERIVKQNMILNTHMVSYNSKKTMVVI